MARIGIMLRAIDDVDGQGIYIRKLCDALFEQDKRNQYVLYYQKPEQLGRYDRYPNVTEKLLAQKSKLLWDQVAVPNDARREKLDVIFHHKFSVPLKSPCPTVVQQRGTEYWMHPEYFRSVNGQVDMWYNRMLIPLACKRSVSVLTNSDALADELTHFVGVPREKMRAIYAAADPSFHEITDADRLKQVRERYKLPDGEFLLMAVKGHQIADDNSGKLAPRKNVEVCLEAYAELQKRDPDALPLVILGIGVAQKLKGEAIADIRYKDRLVMPGFAAFEDMPAIYSMAGGLIFPSRYESFGIPIVEAMACGCPVITSTTTACPEVAGGAAILVDPDDSGAIADGMQRLHDDADFRADLKAKGLRRAADFSWDESARLLVTELEAAALGLHPDAPELKRMAA